MNERFKSDPGDSLVTDLSKRIASLESDIEQLRELLKAVVDNNGGMVSQIEHWEITNALSTWANRDD